jgi:hypothetical protein
MSRTLTDNRCPQHPKLQLISQAIIDCVMSDATETKNAEPSSQSTDKIYMENTLLRVAGAMFCHDAKRAPTRTNEIELNRGVSDKNIVIRPDPRLGQPGPLAHKLFCCAHKETFRLRPADPK